MSIKKKKVLGPGGLEATSDSSKLIQAFITHLLIMVGIFHQKQSNILQSKPLV